MKKTLDTTIEVCYYSYSDDEERELVMKKFVVEQIILTDEQVDEINAGKGIPGFAERYYRTISFPKQAAIQAAYEAGDYMPVAEIQVDELSQVFTVGNMIGREEVKHRITMLADKMKSVSVGDIVIDTATGTKYYVDSFGYKEVY